MQYWLVFICHTYQLDELLVCFFFSLAWNWPCPASDCHDNEFVWHIIWFTLAISIHKILYSLHNKLCLFLECCIAKTVWAELAEDIKLSEKSIVLQDLVFFWTQSSYEQSGQQNHSFMHTWKMLDLLQERSPSYLDFWLEGRSGYSDTTC